MVSGTVSLPSPGCFSPFPHGTRTLSVSREYLALPDGPGGFTQDFTCPALLRIPLRSLGLRVQACHLVPGFFPESSSRLRDATPRSYNPRSASPRRGFGLLPVRSPLLGESLNYFLFLQVLRCFSSLRWPPGSSRDGIPPGCRVVPFGNPGIKGHLHLPRACRSLSRPSSPP